MIKLIIGLGNPGAEYFYTRHNAGQWWVRALAEQNVGTFKPEAKLKSAMASVQIAGEKILLCLPLTYMNESGQSVGNVARYYKISPEEILVAHDELDLDPGAIRLKQGGGHGGHNGLRDIIQHLGSKDFWRLRIGIGHPGHKDRVTPYVLGKPSQEQLIEIESGLQCLQPHLDDLIHANMEKIMREVH